MCFFARPYLLRCALRGRNLLKLGLVVCNYKLLHVLEVDNLPTLKRRCHARYLAHVRVLVHHLDAQLFGEVNILLVAIWRLRRHV